MEHIEFSESKESLENTSALTSLVLPDGSKYRLLSFSPDTLHHADTAKNLIDTSLAENSEIPLKVQLPDLIAELMYYKNIMKGTHSVMNWDTRFFHMDVDKIPENLSWKVRCHRVSLTDKEFLPLLENFLETSFLFGKDYSEEEKAQRRMRIHDHILKVVELNNHHLYMVCSSDNIPIGTFTLVELPFEIQLHSVAGMNSLDLPPVERKMGLLSSAFFHEARKFQKPMTLTCGKAKVQELYLKMGFKEDSMMRGLIFTKKS